MMVNRVTEGSHGRTGQTPAEATCHNRTEGPNVVLLVLCFQTGVTDVGDYVIVLVLVQHLINYLELLIKVLAVLLDVKNEHSILKLF